MLLIHIITMKDYTPLAWALGVVGVVGALVYDNVRTNEIKFEAFRAQPQYELVVQDLNGNGTPEKFYEVNGKKFFLEIDGKNLEDTLRE